MHFEQNHVDPDDQDLNALFDHYLEDDEIYLELIKTLGPRGSVSHLSKMCGSRVILCVILIVGSALGPGDVFLTDPV